MRIAPRSTSTRPPSRLLALAAALLLVLACTSKKEAPAAGPIIEVKAAPVLQKDVPIYVEAVGQTRGNTETEIRARVEGFIEKVEFKEGTMVKKGQVLYTLDPRPFQESVAKAKADLAEAQAQLARTHQDVARFEPLVADKAVSRQEYETSVALEKAAAASVEAGKAALRASEVELGYTKVLAPEAGLIGKSEVEEGTLVGRGMATLLTRISQVDPIHVRFTLAEAEYLHYARLRAAKGEEERKETVPFQMILADNSVHPYEGKFEFVDRAVDAETGTILVEASFPNPQGIVLPGQFAKVRATVETQKGAILVPQRAVQEMQGIYSVMVVKPDDTVESRAVKPGQRVGALWVIDSGLQAGDKIIVEGLQKVRPGAKVSAKMVTIEDTPPPAAPASGA